MVKAKSNPVIALAECSLHISDMKECFGKRFDINGCVILFIESVFIYSIVIKIFFWGELVDNQ